MLLLPRPCGLSKLGFWRQDFLKNGFEKAILGSPASKEPYYETAPAVE